MKIWLFTGGFFTILLILVAANYRFNNEFRIDTSWLALALAPVVIWLAASGQLTEFSGFGLAFKLKQVTQQPLSLAADGSPIEPEQITSDSKAGMDKIEQFIANRVQAITLTAHRPGYYSNWAIREYLERLAPQPFFNYVLISDADGRFAGVADPGTLLQALRQDFDLVERLERGAVSEIPGVSAASLKIGSSKAQALQLMDRHDLARLPVVDEWGRFSGVVEREKVTSSVVAQLVASLGG